ncbi:MAG: hypothetical protein DRR06_11375 [Gammaproteobacteria bacterium]|nr:MAG: hypothetical protein DRR06_11375 [Gammaproteobacteria bacterium]
MGTAIIDLNDSAIQCQHGDVFLAAPGYALLTRQGVITGLDAVRQAWLLPQQSHNQYWHQLNLSPLAGANSHARHHADLAYAQLQALYRDANQPEQVIFTIPGNFTADQLSILLGLVKALPFRAVGLVDAAIAAACQTDQSGEIIHVDIQLHTSVITRIACGEQVSRRHATQHPDISLKGFYDTWAYFIADRFIREYRYDPMHTAAGEQQLRDLLPGWLQQLNSSEEIEIELSAKQGNFRLNVLRTDLISANSQRWQRLADAIARENQPDAILISHRISALPGAEDYIEYAGVLRPDAAITASLSHATHIESGADKLAFITTLPAIAPAPVEKPIPTAPRAVTAGQRLPSHVLYQHQAYAIGQMLHIFVGDDGLDISSSTRENPVDKTRFTLSNREAKVVLTCQQDKLPIQCDGNPDELHVGNIITVHGETLKLIEVL